MMAQHLVSLPGLVCRDHSGEKPSGLLVMGLIVSVHADAIVDDLGPAVTGVICANEEGEIGIRQDLENLRIHVPFTLDPEKASQIVEPGRAIPIIDPRHR